MHGSTEKTEKGQSLESVLDAALACPDCGAKTSEVDETRGETFCSDCGLVLLENAFDTSLSFGYSSMDPELQKRVHNGPPSTVMRHDKGLSTEISYKDVDARGNQISRSMRAQFYRLRKQQSRTNRDKKHEGMIQGLMDIRRYCAKNGLPSDIEKRTAIIYKQAYEQKITHGRSIQIIVAASLYAALKQQNLSRTLDEIESYTGVSRKHIGRAYRLMQRQLKMPLSLPNPMQFIPRFCTKLRLSPDTQTKAYGLLKEYAALKPVGNAPASNAVAAIYIACVLCDERRTQPEIAAVAGLTEVTVRNRYQAMRDMLGLPK